MPREQINYPDQPTILIDQAGVQTELEPNEPIPEGSTAFSDPALHVNWHGESSVIDWPPHVQLSLQFDPAVLKSRVQSLDGDETSTALYTPSLSRAEINRLIKTLRRARDAAYGRDE